MNSIIQGKIKIGFTCYFFNMTDHLLQRNKQGRTRAMTMISKYISDNWNKISSYGVNLFAVYISVIGSTANLYQLLDLDSKKNGKNYLTFIQLPGKKKYHRNNIQVNHFGPFGQKTNKDLEDMINQFQQKAKKQKQKKQLQQLKKKSLQNIKNIHNDPKQMDLQFPTLQQAFQQEDKRKKQLEQMLLNLQEKKKKLNQNYEIARKALNLALKVIKQISEAIAKITAKQSAKIGTKKIPIVGFLAGLGFGIYRAIQGDWAGAAGQVASGAASTVPGPGTAVSLAIDAGLLTKDIIEEKHKADKQLQIANNQKVKIEAQLKQVQIQIQKNKKQLDLLESKMYKQNKIIEEQKNKITQIDKKISKLTFQINQYENKDLIKELTQLPFVHHDNFSFSSDQQFIENIKEFKKVIETKEKNKIAASLADKNEAIAIILALIIPSNYDKKANLSDLLFSANLTKDEVKLIMEALPIFMNNILKANSEALLYNQLFSIEEKQNGQKAICSKYGIKVYLSAVKGQGSIYANKIFCNGWQKFIIQDLTNYRCAIKTLSGYYLSSDLKGEISANSKIVNENSTFEFVKLKDGGVAFRDLNYQYLSIPTLIQTNQIWKQ